MMKELVGITVLFMCLVLGAPLASAQCVGGVDGTAQTGAYLLHNEFQDGRGPGAITAACMRDFIATTTIGNRVTAVGTVSSSDAPNCSTTASNTTITCSGASASFVAGNPVTIQATTTSGPGPTSSLSQPTISSVTPTTYDSTLFLPTSACHVTASVGNITTGTNILAVNNTRLYRTGDSITIAGAGVAGAALTTTVSAVTLADITSYPYQIELTANASTTVALAAVTGFNCSTTWRYQVAAVDALGGKSQASSIVQTTAGASELTPSNYNTITVPVVANAVAYLLYSCRGAACTPALSGIEMPNWTVNAGADPLLLAFNTKVTPTTIVFHDFNMPYAADTYAGSTPPAAATKQQLNTTVLSNNSGTIVLANAPSTTGAFVMRHDNGPAFSSALQAACTGNIAVSITSGYYDIGTPISTGGNICFSAPFQGPASGYTNSDNNRSSTNFNWVGPIGGTVFNASGMSGAVVGGFVISAGENGLGGATPGIGIDYDQIGAPDASKMQFQGITTTNVGIGLRLCNTGNNCDNLAINYFEAAGITGMGAGYGIYQNSQASLAVDVSNFDINANIGVFNAANSGNMNMTHGYCNSGPISEANATLYYGGICFWALGYNNAPFRFQDVHAEYVEKFYYAGGDNGLGGFECDNCRINGMLDWDGYIIRAGQGQVVLNSSAIYIPGAQQGSAPPQVFLEAGSSLVDLGGGRYGSSPALVGGGGTFSTMGSMLMTQVGGTWNNVGAFNFRVLGTGAVAVASLPTCNAANEGSKYAVTNATVTTFASVVAGGGSNHVPVYCNGTNWIIGG